MTTYPWRVVPPLGRSHYVLGLNVLPPLLRHGRYSLARHRPHLNRHRLWRIWVQARLDGVLVALDHRCEGRLVSLLTPVLLCRWSQLLATWFHGRRRGGGVESQKLATLALGKELLELFHCCYPVLGCSEHSNCLRRCAKSLKDSQPLGSSERPGAVILDPG